MKFGDLIEYIMRNIFVEKSYTKFGGETIPYPFLKNQNWVYLSINSLLCIAIVCLPACDVINFEINLIFLINRFSTWAKSQDRNLNILRTKRALKMTLKTFIIIIEGLSLKKIIFFERWEPNFQYSGKHRRVFFQKLL